jgi:soluble lytic murein transglycosylase-like protein
MTVQEQIRQAAIAQGVDPTLAIAVASKESGFNQAARGAAGEIGVFQLMPGTATDLGVDAYSLAGNIEGGIRYLRDLLARYGDPRLALAAYNGGPGNMDRGTVSSRAWSYADSILASVQLPAVASAWPGLELPGLPSAGEASPALLAAVGIGIVSLLIVAFR